MNIIYGYFLTRIPLVLAAFAIVVFLSACNRADKMPSGPPEKVTLACSTAWDAALVKVALVQGYYLREGVDITAHDHTHGKAALQDVLDGKADIATVAETPFMLAVMKGEKISIIATIQTSRKDNAIVARKDKGIRALSDLSGRKVAVTLGTTSDYFMDAFLSARGIPKNTITVVDMKPEEMQDALEKGAVDAVSAFLPWSIYAQKKLGYSGIAFTDADIYTWTFNIVAKQEFIRNNPGKIEKILRALVRAEEFMGKSPSEAQKIVNDSTRIDIALLREIWADIEFGVSLNQSLLLALEDESRWAIKNKLTRATEIPNYLDFIYFDGLKTVKPGAVRILR